MLTPMKNSIKNPNIAVVIINGLNSVAETLYTYLVVESVVSVDSGVLS